MAMGGKTELLTIPDDFSRPLCYAGSALGAVVIEGPVIAGEGSIARL